MNLKEFSDGRLKSIRLLEDPADKKALYNQVFGACELYASLGKKQAEESKKIWEEFSWKFLKIYYGN